MKDIMHPAFKALGGRGGPRKFSRMDNMEPPFGGRAGGMGGGFAGGHGGRRERVLEPGDLKVLALHFLAQQPRHGYEIIKALSELVGGDYSPSPGVIYPTLSLLEDMGYATVNVVEGGRKSYSITAEGQAHLDENKEVLDRILARLSQVKQHMKARRLPEIARAMENLKTALRLRFEEGTPDPDVVRKLAEVIDRAASEIQKA
jgi:DNA-binding PadR family transcriptional regulator